MSESFDLTGNRFGKLVALKVIKDKHKARRWLCLCDCGRQEEVIQQKLMLKKIGECLYCRSVSKVTINREHGYTKEETEFIMAMEEYMRKNQRPFPAFTEVLDVAKKMGYRKDAEFTTVTLPSNTVWLAATEPIVTEQFQASPLPLPPVSLSLAPFIGSQVLFT